MATTTSTDWTTVTPANAPPFSAFTKDIYKSPQDDRDYRIIKLQNGLQAILVHDSKADKAAASLDVAVGHLWDPDDMPGLAHFCEHLLFMGTEQFPKENEYSEYLAKNNGSSNAFTATSNTNYYFSVGTPALSGALTRFAGFFHSPLFAPSCTSRELNAVDSEHKKNHQSDPWRIFQLNKHLSSPGHVWRKFGSGNRDSLSSAARELKKKGLLETQSTAASSLAPTPIPSRISSPAPSVASASSDVEADGGAVGRETRRRLVEWWKKEYCASRMNLCVIGKESLEELAEMVSTLFSPIANRQQNPFPLIASHPFGPDEKGTLVSVDTIMKFHAMEISFPLEYQEPYWRYKPADLISHFVGHEGPGSLHSYLKNKGWITGLSTGSQDLARGIAMFKVTIYLTDDGFANHRAISLATFKYLNMLRSSELAPFHQTESHVLSNIRFRFQEKRRPEDYATFLAEHLSLPSVPRELLLQSLALTWDWEGSSGIKNGQQKVNELLDGMRVTSGRAVLMAKAEEHEKLIGGNKPAEWQTEPWYGTKYRVEKFDQAYINEAESQNDIPELFLPHVNEFIPTNLDVDKRDLAEHEKRPHLIRETRLSSLWHKKDDRFWVPKASVIMEFRSPAANTSALASVLTRLYSDLVNDSLTEYAYAADLAGLKYAFVPQINGLYCAMSGYNDKLAILVKTVLEKLKDLTIDPKRLAVMQEQAKRDWENFFLGQSYQMSDYFGKYLMTETQWTPQEKLAELSNVTPTLLQEHIRKLLSDTHLRILVNGNVYKDEAIRIAELAEQGLTVSSVPAVELSDRCLLLPEASNHIWASDVPNPNQANSALTYYLHIGPIADQRLRVTSALLAQILSEPAFNVLRTKEQLGYIVSAGQWSLSGSTHKGIRIIVQSEREPEYLEQRVEKFLESMKAVITDMPQEEFTEQKAGLERKWREADKNLSEETTKFWNHISNGQQDFIRSEHDANLLQDITKQDILSLFASRVDPSSSTRSKLSVHMRSKKPRPQKVSLEASRAFEASVASAGLSAEELALKAKSGEELPTAPDFGRRWAEVLSESGVESNKIQKLMASLPEIIKKYPVEGEGEAEPRADATYIKDVNAFKQSLSVADYATPLVEWGDLPVSKF